MLALIKEDGQWGVVADQFSSYPPVPDKAV